MQNIVVVKNYMFYFKIKRVCLRIRLNMSIIYKINSKTKKEKQILLNQNILKEQLRNILSVQCTKIIKVQ
jgi:hypothetical protein